MLDVRVKVRVKKRGRFPITDYRAVLRPLADRWCDEIRQRTSGGRGQDGRFFAGYSPRTGKTGHVTLRETGAMQNALRPLSVTARSIRIGFSDARQRAKAAAHQFGVRRRNLPARPWFMLSRRQVKAGVKALAAALRRTKG